MTATKKAKIGDVAEIATPAGLAYVQYTHDGESMGELVRVLPGIHKSRPAEFAELVSQKELYFIFYTLNYALRARQAEIVAHCSVPDWARPYPLMRLDWGTDENGSRRWKIADASVQWTLENHKRIPPTKDLSPEQMKLSIHCLWPHPVMVKELARGWTPERDDELTRQDSADADKEPAVEVRAGAHYYLYFHQEDIAHRAGQRLVGKGFDIDVQKGADGASWLVLVKTRTPADMAEHENLTAQLESLAVEFGGEYDGFELAI